MKRFWIGFLILSILLCGGSAVTICMVKTHQPIADDLQQSAQAALDGNWEQAARLAGQAQTRWEKYHTFTAAFADHSPMDELDGLFAELEIFYVQREQTHFAAVCAHLAQLAQAMADSHAPSWWNLL